MLDRFVAHLGETGLIPEGAKVLGGYSGGADSTCMLHLMSRCGLNIVAAHLHHGQRPEADQELEKCSAFCKELGVPFISGKADVPRLARDMKVGLEEAGRHARYEFFAKAAAEIGCELIATGHTIDDHIETVLLNLTRGSGLAGLSGIPARRENIIRPILSFTRSETRAYCNEHGLWFHDDPANASLEYSRVRIRKNILPELEAINPAVRDAICRLASTASEEDAFLNSAAAAALEPCEIVVNGPLRFLTMDKEVWLDRVRLAHLPQVLLRRAIRLAAGVLGAELDYNQTMAVVEGLKQSELGSVTAEGGNVAIEWAGRTVSLRQLAFEQYTEGLSLPGSVTASDWTLAAEPADPAEYGRERGALEVVVDLDQIQGESRVSPPIEGSTLQPLNLSGTKKVSDVLADAKLTETARRIIPIVSDASGPVWIPSLALADRVKITSGTLRAVKLRLGPSTQPSHNKETASLDRT